MKQQKLETIKKLIINNINESISFTDLQGRLISIQQTLENMKRPKERTLFEVKTISKQKMSKIEEEK
jgi:hypothetical protein